MVFYLAAKMLSKQQKHVLRQAALDLIIADNYVSVKSIAEKTGFELVDVKSALKWLQRNQFIQCKRPTQDANGRFVEASRAVLKQTI